MKVSHNYDLKGKQLQSKVLPMGEYWVQRDTSSLQVFGQAEVWCISEATYQVCDISLGLIYSSVEPKDYNPRS